MDTFTVQLTLPVTFSVRVIKVRAGTLCVGKAEMFGKVVAEVHTGFNLDSKAAVLNELKAQLKYWSECDG